jgi:hypothetical protein
MKHRLYKGWIVARGELSPDQERELHLHLETCEACRAFAQAEQAVEMTFSSIKMLEPTPGFTRRWKTRLDEKRTHAHRRQTSLLLGLLSFGTTALFFPIVLQVIILLISPEDMLLGYAKGTIEWLAWLELLGEFSLTFINTLISTIPVGWWLSIAVVLAGMITISGLSLRRLGLLQRKKGV